MKTSFSSDFWTGMTSNVNSFFWIVLMKPPVLWISFLGLYIFYWLPQLSVDQLDWKQKRHILKKKKSPQGVSININGYCVNMRWECLCHHGHSTDISQKDRFLLQVPLFFFFQIRFFYCTWAHIHKYFMQLFNALRSASSAWGAEEKRTRHSFAWMVLACIHPHQPNPTF